MMISTPHLARLRDDLRERRRTRAARRVLEAQLASYVGAAEVDDLLASLSHHDGPDAEEIRSILVRKRTRDNTRLFAA
jgi:hypothetical protein